MSEIKVYTSESCGPCQMVKAHLYFPMDQNMWENLKMAKDMGMELLPMWTDQHI